MIFLAVLATVTVACGMFVSARLFLGSGPGFLSFCSMLEQGNAAWDLLPAISKTDFGR